MKILSDFVKVFLTAEIVLNAILYFAIILVQIFYPDVSWLQLLVAAVIILAVQGIFKYTKAKGDKDLLAIHKLLEENSDDVQ